VNAKDATLRSLRIVCARCDLTCKFISSINKIISSHNIEASSINKFILQYEDKTNSIEHILLQQEDGTDSINTTSLPVEETFSSIDKSSLLYEISALSYAFIATSIEEAGVQ
jgi:hypothetical protein